MSDDIKIITRQIAFLMPHQDILPDLKELAAQIYPAGINPDLIDRDSPEYLLGAYEALINLITSLEEKGSCQ